MFWQPCIPNVGERDRQGGPDQHSVRGVDDESRREQAVRETSADTVEDAVDAQGSSVVVTDAEQRRG